MMGRVKSFKLAPGTRVGNYRIIETIGRGWEGEVYKVEEVPTDALRALKMFRTGELCSIRHLIHFAWYYEQLRATGSVPIYYHWGQWFLDDDNGCWFLVFEYVPGLTLKAVEPTEDLFFEVVNAMARVHALEYAVGDISALTNVVIRDDGKPVFIDCNPGTPEHPNSDFRADCLDELPTVAKAMFGMKTPARVKSLLTALKGEAEFLPSTLTRCLEQRD